MSKISSNSSWSSRFWLSGTYHFTNNFHSFNPFKYHSNNRSPAHHFECDIKRFLSTPRNHLTKRFIVIIKKFLIWLSHFHSYNMKSYSFKTSNNLSYNTTTNTIRFQNNQSSLYICHFSQYKKIKAE